MLSFISKINKFLKYIKNYNKNIITINKFKEIEKFIDESVIITNADANGRITYVNKKFEEISGWSLDEVIGKNHNILNSGVHPKIMWIDMYKTVITEKKVWNYICTNKKKDGSFYHVDTYIKAEFTPKGKLVGFKSIRQDVTEIINQKLELEKKNTYLEHAAKIIRHDMHSGINTYIPRGLSSLERRLTKEDIEQLKIEAPLKMIKEGLKHTQKVYKGVYEFTNLVKKDSVLTKSECDIRAALNDYLTSTAYKSQVLLDNSLPILMVNESLFCTAIDNLIRNGLRYNDSPSKLVKIYSTNNNNIIIEDNGRGMSHEDFIHLSKPYTRKVGQKESGTGLGLNICIAILEEHGFKIHCEKLNNGTKITIDCI